MTKTAKVLTLRKKGMSNAKIAKKLKCKVGHVHSIVWKAKRDALPKPAPAKRISKDRLEALNSQGFKEALMVAENLEARARGLLVKARLVRDAVTGLAKVISE